MIRVICRSCGGAAALALMTLTVASCGDDAPATFEPVATISATPQRGPAPLTVTFDGSASRTIPGQRTFEWDLGDGSADDREQLEHTYAEPGFYRVTLAVTDSAGVVGTDSA